MTQLDFATIDSMTAMLGSAELADLVAVWPRRQGEGLHLVYNAAALPKRIPDGCEARRLHDIDKLEPEMIDGLLACFTALDTLHPRLHTKGPHFFPLEELYLELGQRKALHRSMHNLARTLVSLLDGLAPEALIERQRMTAKILQLALPALLDQREAAGLPVTGLVAVRPGSDLTAFVEGTSGDWIRADAAPGNLALEAHLEWVVALEELSTLGLGLGQDNPHVMELRGVLYQAGYTDALRRSCRALARRLAARAVSRAEYWGPAWTLMAEVWLGDEDVTDLVAFFPHADFERFADTGEGLRVYRALDEQARDLGPGPRWDLEDLARRDIPTQFRRCGFSLLPLDVITSKTEGTVEPDQLDRLLWKAGHETSVAETLALLARDGLQYQARGGLMSPEILCDLARRALMLFSLGNPWAWRQGRYEQLIGLAYQVLQKTLEYHARSADESARDYYQALILWYGCHDVGGEEVNQRLHQMAVRLRSFLRATRLDEHDPQVLCARYLIEVEEAALYPLAPAGGGRNADRSADDRLSPVDTGHSDALVSRQETGLDCLSPRFQQAWAHLRALRDDTHHMAVRERNPQLQQHKLQSLLMRVRRGHRSLFVLPHEMVILGYIYSREIRELERRVHELRTEARLEILPVNPRVDFRREVELAFEVHNTSRIEARDVEIVLARDPSFDLLDHSSIREFDVLLPGVPRRFTYRIRAVQQPSATFRLSYSYQGLGASQSELIQLPVRSLDQVPFKMKGDPYQFGRAITNPADFYGRSEEMRRLLASLYRGGRTNFMLRGPRRMGKTSMLHMLKAALEAPEVRRRFDIPPQWDGALQRFRPVLLDLQAHSFQNEVDYVARFFHSLLDAVSKTIAPDMRRHLLRMFEKRWREVDVPRAVLQGLDQALACDPNAQVVVLLDEYDEVYRPQGRVLDTALRHVVQSEPRLTWIIASTQFLYKEGKSHGSPWFNILDIVELDCLTERAGQRLIEDPSRNEQVEWQSDAIVALQDETGRHPAFLQLFCSRIMTRLNRETQNYVLPATIAELAELIVEERETIHSHFEFYWADTPGVGRLILLAADETETGATQLRLQNTVRDKLTAHFGELILQRVLDARDDPVAWWTREFDDGMAWVSQVVKAITFNRATRNYTFTVPLFRRWLQHKKTYVDLSEAALSRIRTEMERDGLH